MIPQDDLLAALRAARPELDAPADPASLPAQATLARIIGRPARGRRWLVGTAVGLTAAAAAAVAIGIAAQPDVSHQNNTAAGNNPAAGNNSAAQPTDLRTAVLAAFDRQTGSIAHSVTTWTVGGATQLSYERWTYPASADKGQHQQFRQLQKTGGQPSQDVEFSYDAGSLPAGTNIKTKQQVMGEVIDVEYGSRTWSDQHNTPLTPAVDEYSPDQLRQLIAAGHFTSQGHVTLDGKDTILLTLQSSAGPNSESLLWVDAQTYLPVKSSFHGEVGSPGAMRTSGYVTYYDNLPATQANLAQLRPQIPAGFRQVAAPQVTPGG